MRPKSAVLEAIRAVRRRLAAGEITVGEAERLIVGIRLEHYTRVLAALETAGDNDDGSTTAQPGVGLFTHVGVRLTGIRSHVGAALALLAQVTELESVSDPYPHAGEHIRVYATISRRTGLTGGIK